MKWSDLQWGSGRLYVQRQLQDVRGMGSFFQEPKTRSGRRTLQLGEGTTQALREHSEFQRVQKELAGQRWQENDLMFPSKIGTPLNASNLRLDFNRVIERSGVPRVRFHDSKALRSIANAQQWNTSDCGFEDPGARKTKHHSGYLRSSIQRNAGDAARSDGPTGFTD